jgi:hypothetical protein
LNKTALNLLEAAYKHAEIREIEGQRRIMFGGTDAANALDLSTAVRWAPRAVAYQRALDLLEEAGAVKLAEIRGQELLVGESFYEITPQGIAMLRAAGRIA